MVGELVASEEGAQPGFRTTVALKLIYDPGWHTYWISPGIGEATSIEWTLPDGWVASGIDWPAPVKIYTEAGEVFGHGFEGVSYLPIDSYYEPEITTLSDVLAFTDGDGQYRGLLINALLATSLAATTASRVL